MADELKSYNPTFGEKIKYSLQDLMMGLGANSYDSGKLSGGIKDLLGFTPLAVPMGVSEMSHGMDAGSPLQIAVGAMGAMPAGRLASPALKGAAEALPIFKDKTEEALYHIAKALDFGPEEMAKYGVDKIGQTATKKTPLPDSPFVVPEVSQTPTSFMMPKAEPVPTQKAKVTNYDIDGNISYSDAPKGTWDNPSSFDDLGAELTAMLAKPETINPTVPKATANTLPAPETYKGFTLNPVMNEADGFINWQVLGSDKSVISTHRWLDLAQEAAGEYGLAGVAKATKKAPIDQGISMDDWMAKNPGGTINEYLGVKDAPAQPIKHEITTATPDENTWAPKDSQYYYSVPPRPAGQPDTAPPGWLSALDQEEATRQANAAAGGYTTDAFHGTRGFDASVADPYANYAVPRGEMPINPDFYSTPSGDLAEMYAAMLDKNPAKGYHADYPAQIMPLKLNTNDYHVVDGGGKIWSKVNQGAISEARKLNKPGVRIDNIYDEPMTTTVLPEPKTIFITLPGGENTVRSKFAKFDPTKFNMNDLLAGLAGAGIVGPGLFGEDQSK